MKIALLQFAPNVGTVEENIKRADDLLRQSKIPVDLGWLVLPEMAFSGYNFHSLEEIEPYLEPTTAGVTTRWAIQVAKHYNCHVTVGYPERTSDAPPVNYLVQPLSSTKWMFTHGIQNDHPPDNSAVTVSPTGDILNNYRKSFLYYTDETWASEPPSRFATTSLGNLGPVTLGICMDINPHRFLAPWEAYEFATACLAPIPSVPSASSPIPLICVSMAWLCHLTPTELTVEPSSPDVATVAYWVERFQPIVEKSKEVEGAWYVLLANRCGVEKSVCYAGSSTVIKIEGGAVSLFETCGKSEEKCLVVDLSERPKYQVRSGR
ncbi:hypothetical protein N0V90_001924 [Kalmusia sp. IMI 367209]|nr:hypothetical protein N0V90_001924 [Kalmusia sp. IMI 367209]